MSSNETYLTGKCLVAMPSMQDEHFKEALIFICSHSENGAMGFVVNKVLHEFSFADLANQLPIKTIRPIESIELHHGGPLEKVRGFVLHSSEYVKDDTVLVNDNIAISSSLDVITDIAFGLGPKENLIALGYASWAPNQLEQEIINNNWLVVNPTPELVFRTKDEEKWKKAIDSLGFDVMHLSRTMGRA